MSDIDGIALLIKEGESDIGVDEHGDGDECLSINCSERHQ